MKKTVEILIGGMVQGVGYRPFIHRMAARQKIGGSLQATHRGLEITASGEEAALSTFLHLLREEAPAAARVEVFEIKEIPLLDFSAFIEKRAEKSGPVESPLPPDRAICPGCRKELEDPGSRRYHYPFISCPDCGPRYSIIRDWPFTREHSSFAPFEPCPACQSEFHDPENRRYRYPLISCPDCGPPFTLYDCRSGESRVLSFEELPGLLLAALQAGKTLAVKDTGGYLLIADACNERAVKRLRERKQYACKPFALLYHSLKMIEEDCELSGKEKTLLQGSDAPIVVLRRKAESGSGISLEAIAPGLHTLGIMLPNSPLLTLISQAMNSPLVATSANHAGSQMLYTEKAALKILPAYADLILSHRIKLQLPQDDTVLAVSPKHGQVILRRRGRGRAPDYPARQFRHSDASSAAMGADMKSAFALLQKGRIHLSQYLGNQASEESRRAFKKTILHLAKVLDFSPQSILLDSHPDAFSTEMGRELGRHKYPFYFFPHHRAHFAAVLSDHRLFDEDVLGIIWDGYGWGEDRSIWGGEWFLYKKREMQHIAQLSPYQLLADSAMVLEPRVSALCLFAFVEGADAFLRPFFDEKEWKHYQAIRQRGRCPFTSSMGRLFDAVASILQIAGPCNSFEGEAAIKLEQAASNAYLRGTMPDPYHIEWGREISIRQMLREIIIDIRRGLDTEKIALRFHVSLAHLACESMRKTGIRHVVFAGGVFQNSLLPDLLRDLSEKETKLYFARHICPNDESIALGQTVLHLLKKHPDVF